VVERPTVFRRHVNHEAHVGARKDVPDTLAALNNGANLDFRGNAEPGHQRRKLISEAIVAAFTQGDSV